MCVSNEIWSTAQMLSALQIWFQHMENGYMQDNSHHYPSPCVVWVRQLYHCSFTAQMHEDELDALLFTYPIRYENHTLVLMKADADTDEVLTQT